MHRPLPTVDLLGHPLTDRERDVLEIYEALKALAVQPDISPAVRQNVRKALACLWQASNDLHLQFEQLYDCGV